jgi:uncharacterized membrane protein
METQMLYEVIGYVASALVAISLMMSSVLRLRVLNLFGSAAFTVYGVLIGAYPVAVVNLIIVFINLYYLRQMLQPREYFHLLRVSPASDYLREFLRFYRGEIGTFLPDFSFTPRDEKLTFFVLRDMVPVGLFIGEVPRPGTLRVDLDFVIPKFRDFRTGRYLFGEKAEFFREQGIREIVSPAGNARHEAYLRRMGFEPAPGGESYRLAIA